MVYGPLGMSEESPGPGTTQLHAAASHDKKSALSVPRCQSTTPLDSWTHGLMDLCRALCLASKEAFFSAVGFQASRWSSPLRLYPVSCELRAASCEHGQWRGQGTNEMWPSVLRRTHPCASTSSLRRVDGRTGESNSSSVACMSAIPLSPFPFPSSQFLSPPGGLHWNYGRGLGLLVPSRLWRCASCPTAA
jgi:hypothetical protein